MIWYDHGLGGWGFVGMGIGMVLFWTLLILGIVLLVRYTMGQGPSATSTWSSPENDLASRFARGEISETEYRDRLTVLREHARR